MWNKVKEKINPYILVFVLFILIICFIDLNFNGIIAEFITSEILVNIEQVEYLDILRPKGIFRWDRLKSLILVTSITGFILFEVFVYYILKNSKRRNIQVYAEEMTRRFKLYTSGKIPEENRIYKEIDLEIEKLINKTEEMKFEKDMEIQKKKDLVTYLAHDLKTPLTSIIGYLSLMKEEDIPDKYKKVYLERTLEKAYHLEDLTNQFFDITRFDLQEIPLQKKKINLTFFINQIVDEIYPILKDKELNINLFLEEDLNIVMDGKLMARVFNNLLKNAINYSYKNSNIYIKSYSKDNFVYIDIENQGDTLNEEEIKLIFKKFYRKEMERNQSAGSGLGLAIAKNIIEKHDGEISVVSKDNKTKFTICLPKT